MKKLPFPVRFHLPDIKAFNAVDQFLFARFPIVIFDVGDEAAVTG